MNYSLLGLRAVEAMQYDLLALAALPHLPLEYIPWSSSALRPAGIQFLLNEIVLNDRRCIVEYGSGISTVFLAEMVQKIGGQLVSFDHDAEWQGKVRNWMSPAAAKSTQLIHAPLVRLPGNASEDNSAWYDSVVIAEALKLLNPIDLVVVDGPPAYEIGLGAARLPALEATKPFFGNSVIIVLDDINRIGEQQIAVQWSASLNATFTNLVIQAGIAVWKIGNKHYNAFY